MATIDLEHGSDDEVGYEMHLQPTTNISDQKFLNETDGTDVTEDNDGGIPHSLQHGEMHNIDINVNHEPSSPPHPPDCTYANTAEMPSEKVDTEDVDSNDVASDHRSIVAGNIDMSSQARSVAVNDKGHVRQSHDTNRTEDHNRQSNVSGIANTHNVYHPIGQSNLDDNQPANLATDLGDPGLEGCGGTSE